MLAPTGMVNGLGPAKQVGNTGHPVPVSATPTNQPTKSATRISRTCQSPSAGAVRVVTQEGVPPTPGQR